MPAEVDEDHPVGLECERTRSRRDLVACSLWFSDATTRGRSANSLPILAVRAVGDGVLAELPLHGALLLALVPKAESLVNDRTSVRARVACDKGVDLRHQTWV